MARACAVALRRRPDPIPPAIYLALALALVASLACAQPAPSPTQPPAQAQTAVPTEGPDASGIVRPPETVDSGIAKPTPDISRFPTPVVPPPRTQGDQTPVVPK